MSSAEPEQRFDQSYPNQNPLIPEVGSFRAVAGKDSHSGQE